MEKNWSYKITEGEHAGKTLWSGRYCAVAGFVFRRIEGIWAVLANKRGSGTPDFQGTWNAPCGFLEGIEDAQHGVARETKEETGYIVKPEKFLQVFTHTDPKTSNKGHVTIRHMAVFFEHELEAPVELSGGEENEVAAVKWIPISQLDHYEWAFDHAKVIQEMFYNYIYPIEEYTFLTPGEFFLLAHPEWLRNNPYIKEILQKKILANFNIND